ncbi:flavodoxin [Desulfovibrio litoralis]|uniref:Flavodoxin n=1 Tax=Desulfovibrio litoralis DSM 11393 TaxID=1121455 RepID=A0A1M7TLM3_9BACT|nr:flavodoxin [Desulfovibrio litoralis]SHN71624.1 Flavodoxin [Desulfovibrio litoralis DSM 11393]
MKMIPFMLVVLSFVLTSPVHANENKKTLIVYFSHTQTTEKVALEIHKKVGGDIFRIETVQQYPTEHKATVTLAEKERDANARPALKTQVENIDSYDVIFIGYPIWWYTLPMPLYTFLESYDLSGKTIIPFCTHGGSSMSGTEDVIKKLQPNAKVLDGLAVSRNIIRSNPDTGAEKPVAEWLSKLGY